MEAIAILRKVPASPRKTRKIVNTIRNRQVLDAIAVLQYLPHKPTTYLIKLLQSAIANLQYKNKDQKILKTAIFIKEIYVNGGSVIRRIRPRAQGRATPIRKPTCHITVKVAINDLSIQQKATPKKPSIIAEQGNTAKSNKQTTSNTDQTIAETHPVASKTSTSKPKTNNTSSVSQTVDAQSATTDDQTSAKNKQQLNKDSIPASTQEQNKQANKTDKAVDNKPEFAK